MPDVRHQRFRLLFGLALCALAPLLFGFLCFPLVAPLPSGVVTPVPAATFAPTVGVSVAQPTPGVASNVVASLSVPAGSTLPIGAAFNVPAGWTVASDGAIANGSIVGSIVGSMTVADPLFFDCNTTVSFNTTPPPTPTPALADTEIELFDATTTTSPEVSGRDEDNDGKPEVVEDVNPANGLPDGVDTYPAFLNTVLPGTHKARYFGSTIAAGLSDLYVNIIIDELAPGGPYRVLAITNDPTAPPESATSQFCSPQSLTLTLFGSSAGTPVYKNPATAGKYTFTAQLASEFDQDNDGDSNGLDNCPAIANASQADADQDYVGNACETDAVANFDVDGDGIENGYDNCIFTINANQADSDYDDLGDACDPSANVPTGANYYLSCTDPVGIGQVNNTGASCVQSLPATATPTATPRSVGGIAELPRVESAASEARGEDSLTHGRLAVIIAAIVALIGLAGGALYARRRTH